ncbi:nucleotide exchange factor GrpE [Mycoplasmoides alvi]|uniref:nucleotide exchange factor GrpE n=1 Tax=Mycoplasmoides alvi TaxID=78580 RepID=UPI000698DA6F|nr:nucleotide exchange factor GrpE [Mycoplasmoides alvi]
MNLNKKKDEKILKVNNNENLQTQNLTSKNMNAIKNNQIKIQEKKENEIKLENNDLAEVQNDCDMKANDNEIKNQENNGEQFDEIIPIKENSSSEFDNKIQNLLNLVNNNMNTKIKAIRNEFDELIKELSNLYKVQVSEFEKTSAIYAKANEDIQDKIQKLEERASKEIAQKIAEMDARKVEEIENAKKFAMEKAANGVLKVVDTIEFAINFASKDPAIKNYVSGFKMALDQFLKWLEQLEIHQIEIKPGDQFDEYKMSALETTKSNLPKNSVVEVKISGYMMHDKVIRHASVAVSDGSLESKQVATKQIQVLNQQVKQHVNNTQNIKTNNFSNNASSVNNKIINQQQVQKNLGQNQTVQQHKTQPLNAINQQQVQKK